MEKFFEFKTAAIEMFGDIGAWTYDEWKKLNDDFFEGQNQVGPIYWIADSSNKSLGCYSSSENTIYLHKGLVRPPYPTNIYKWCLKNLNQRLASDVLLHEMIHQLIHQSGGWEGETTHNNQRFVNEVNRIAEVLGLNITAKVIETASRKAGKTSNDDSRYLDLQALSNFPYSTRPRTYYYERK